MNLETRIQLLSTLRFPHLGMGTRTREINFDVFVIKSQYVKRTPYNKSSYFIFSSTAKNKRGRFLPLNFLTLHTVEDPIEGTRQKVERSNNKKGCLS